MAKAFTRAFYICPAIGSWNHTDIFCFYNLTGFIKFQIYVLRIFEINEINIITKSPQTHMIVRELSIFYSFPVVRSAALLVLEVSANGRLHHGESHVPVLER